MTRSNGLGRRLARGLMALGATIWGFGLGLWAMEDADAGVVPNDYPGVTVQELKTMPKAEVKAFGKTFRQVVELQDGGKYSEAELEQAQTKVAQGCSVYEDASYDCTAASYEDADGKALKEYEDASWAHFAGPGVQA